MVHMESFVGERIGNIIREFTGKIQSINQKYATPKIKISRGAKIALLLLEIYLIVLVGLLAYSSGRSSTGVHDGAGNANPRWRGTSRSSSPIS